MAVGRHLAVMPHLTSSVGSVSRDAGRLRSSGPMPSCAVTVTPARRLRGRIRVPGDKSIAHRYALFAALSEGRSTLAHFAPGADCRSTLRCLRGLGVEIDDGPDGTVTVLGRGLGRLCSPDGPLDAGNSGTTMRLVAGILAGHRFSATLTGDASLSRR